MEFARSTGTFNRTSGPGKMGCELDQYNKLESNPAGLNPKHQEFLRKTLEHKTNATQFNPKLWGQPNPVEVRLKETDQYVAKGLTSGGDPIVARGQAMLSQAGYHLGNYGYRGVDGIQGEMTTKNLIEFQNAVGLKPTGKFDQDTMKTLHLVTEAGLKRMQIWKMGRENGLAGNEGNIRENSHQTSVNMNNLHDKTQSIHDNKQKIGEKGLTKINLPGVGDTYFERQLVGNINTFVSRCDKELGVKIEFESVFRSKEYQQHLYDVFKYPDKHNGKRSPENVQEMNQHGLWGTNVVAEPEKAPHAMGSAFDLKNVNDLITQGKFKDVIKIAKECGFTWQGQRDKVHFGNYEFKSLGYKSKEDMVEFNNQIFKNK